MTALQGLEGAWLQLGEAQREAVLAQLADQGLGRSEAMVSPGQASMLFLEQLRPGNPGYRVAAVMRVHGPLDPDVLRAALDRVVARHDVLRSSFRHAGGTLTQVVERFASARLREHDLSGATASEVEEYVAELTALPLPVDEPPLWRMHLVRTAPAEALLVLHLHHLICDGWSIGLLVSEIGRAYRALLSGTEPELPELSIQYGDYAAWQRRRLDASVPADPARAWWQDHLAGMPAALALPTDRPRPAVQSFIGGAEGFSLDAATMVSVTRCARAHGVTAFMVLLTAFQVLLSRFSGQTKVVVGVPDAGRRRAEVEPLIGFFVNMLPIAADLGDAPSFVTALARTAAACKGAYANAEVPFETIVEDAHVDRDLSRPPLFQAAFSYQSEPSAGIDLGPGVAAERVARPANGARFDLEIQSFATEAGLSGWFEYDAALFDGPSVARLARAFESLVWGLVADPSRPIDRQPLMSASERDRVIALAGGPRVAWPAAGLIPELLDAAAAARPDEPALRDGERLLDHAGLAALRHRLARLLGERGLGRGSVVAVALERSLELVVSLQAVMAAGAAYLPVDLDAPAERLRDVLADADLLISTADVAHRLGDGESLAACPEWLWDRDGAEIDGFDSAAPDVEILPDDLAYVIYTSGSTGRPKGVANTHRGLRNRLLWMQDAYPIGPGDRIAQKTPYTFDVSVWEFFWPTLAGAALVMLPPGDHRDPAAVARLVRDAAITTMHFVPSMLRLHLAQGEAAQATALRRVICSGEALPRELVQQFHAVFPGERVALENLYGPTEAAIDVTAWPCRAGEDGPVPIGRPIANTSVHVLDAHREPVPLGVVGELYLGGDNVAAGYVGRPDLTAERFVPDPFEPGGRLYRTGDLGRLVDDGGPVAVVEYLGRADRQVKLRGLRVELGEIEAVLVTHPTVAGAVVSARTFGTGDVRLVGYVQPAPGAEVDGAELGSHLRRYVPDYMVPGIWLSVAGFPLSANGKCDESKLPQPDVTPTQRTVVAPRDDLERLITGVWAETLGIEQVGVDDAFFDLGGHSLLLIQVRERLGELLGRELSMVELFQHPTPAALAAHLRGTSTNSAATAGRGRADQRLRARSGQRRADLRRTQHRQEG
ncbi:amino acid adenylation domain-containing protein [Propioniciclava soli]|uniref:Amino acid adenylation domain-containing protein n=1 Tax=Propioniciclava soli TaxID=2775081 RepID=A0ABZ3CF22_9ACTN